jgi:hypothetical protein
VNVPYWDQWEFISLFEKMNNGTLTFQDLFSQHNEHRIFFPKIIMLIIAFLTGYNNKYETYFIEFLLFINLAISFLVIKKSFNIKSIPYWFVPIPFLIFTLNQYENMLWGFQIGFVMVQTISLTTFYFIFMLAKTEDRKFKYFYFISSIISGIIASFSSIMGLVIWPSGILQFLISPFKRRDKIIYSFIWTITGIASWIIYFINYHKPGHHPDIFFFLHNPVMFSKYFFTCIGTALFWSKDNAFIGGSIIFFFLLITLYCLYKNNRLKDNAFWIGGTVFSLLTVLSITIGRCGFGVEQSTASRYVTFSIIILISLYAILIDLNIQKKQILIKSLLILLIFMILISIPYSYKFGFEKGKNKKNDLEATIPSLLNYEKATKEELEKLYPSSELLKQRAFFLKMNNISIFNKDFLKTEYPEYTFIPKKEDIIIEKVKFNKYGKWSDTVWPGTKPDDPFVEYILGSRVDSDGDTGLIKSNCFRVSAPSYLIIYVMYGPDKKGQILGIDINNDENIDLYYNNDSCSSHIWYKWFLDMTDYSGNDIKIIVEDKGDDFGQWLGVSQPVLYKKTDK